MNLRSKLLVAPASANPRSEVALATVPIRSEFTVAVVGTATVLVETYGSPGFRGAINVASGFCGVAIHLFPKHLAAR